MIGRLEVPCPSCGAPAEMLTVTAADVRLDFPCGEVVLLAPGREPYARVLEWFAPPEMAHAN